MTIPDDASRPDGVPADAWGEYLWALSRAERGEMEPRHFQKLEQLRGQYPQLKSEVRR